ncbi:hypothetical protein FRC20_001055 [Serendipita sp. 405]|nr:hypothetical protein FRC20_001055 [Serendipita sp. 405]
MLTIDPTSVCDVCNDQYGVVCLPYLIPCGHTFCRSCLVNISDNNPKGAACPLCRERFTLESICLVRVDPADPLPKLSYDGFLPSDDTDSDFSDRARSPWNQEPRIREEARALELRVQKAASVKCTFEEVSELRDDIQNWLLTEPKYKPNGKFPALRLSAALLRAILLNSLAYTEASKASKLVENGLLEKIKQLEANQTVLEADVKRAKLQTGEKQHEIGQLRLEIERLRKANPNAAGAPKSGLETLMARTSAQHSVPRSMTAPLPPGSTPPPIRNQTRPRPIQGSTPQKPQAYPKVWLPMIDDTEESGASGMSAAENTYTYSNLARHRSMLRTPGTPTPTTVRR